MVYDKNRYWLGPASWSQKLLSWLPYGKLFNYPAYEHDVNYSIGGNRFDKKHADSKFARGMLKICVSKTTWNPLSYLFAFIYYFAVAIFGFIFFNWKSKDC